MSSLRDQLQAIYDKRGQLTPALVVGAATNPKHPLHSRFDWDDTSAAAKWRLEQASALIRSVRITYSDDPTAPRDVRAFVALKGEDTHKSNYVPTEDALNDDFSRKLLLASMNREWRVFKKRYEHMAEFAELLGAEAGAA